MSSKVRRRGVRSLLTSFLGAGSLLLGVPAIAAACTSGELNQTFSQFGDSAYYELAPGGSFESGAQGWSLSNAGVVAGNESYNLAPGSHSLEIGSDGSAVSPWLCVSTEMPTFRFVVRQVSGSASTPLTASVRWLNLLGLIQFSNFSGSIPVSDQWAPTPALHLSSNVPLLLLGLSEDVQLTFHASAGSVWQLDDVYLDPYRR